MASGSIPIVMITQADRITVLVVLM